MLVDHVPFTRSVKQVLIDRAKAKYIANSDWQFSAIRWDMYFSEMNDWLGSYLPVDLKGKTVLDVGAGEGETAKFFLDHGASRVFAVESDSRCFSNLLANAVNHLGGIVPICREFRLSDLDLPVDFVKVDIEGYEEMLLGVKLGVPVVVEVHGLQLRDRFSSAGFRLVHNRRYMGVWWCCYGYWGC